jgi:hypothetical protein
MPAVIGTAEMHNHSNSLSEQDRKLRALELAVGFTETIIGSSRTIPSTTAEAIVESAEKFDAFLRS